MKDEVKKAEESDGYDKYVIEEEDELELRVPQSAVSQMHDLFMLTHRSLNFAALAELAISKIDEIPSRLE